MLITIKKLKFIIFFIIIASCCSCSFFDKKKEKTAVELKDEGLEAFNEKNYDKAIEAFERLKDWYPFSKYAILAELKIPDSYYYLEEYEDAISGYEEFERLHPNNEATPYAVYQIGLCYFERIDTIDRDQTSAKKALETFTRLVRQYPNGLYADKAKQNNKKCLKNLSEHEFYVGNFYFKSKHYKAALHRYKNVIKKYSDINGSHKKAQDKIEICKQKIEDKKETKKEN